MKSEPQHFYCKSRDTGEWSSCTKKDICDGELGQDEFNSDKGDYNYIENWQEQTQMLCESKQRIGFLGACFFIGVLVASTIIPVGYLSDVIGRKWLFVGSIVVLQIACLGFIFATTLDQLYIFMFLIGLSFPGRIIVGINFAYELIHKEMRVYIQPLGQIAQGATLIITAFYFQIISKSVIQLEIVHFSFTVYLLIQTLFYPESPRFLYSKEKFNESRNGLQKLANMNSNPKFDKNFKYNTEKEFDDLTSQGRDAKTEHKLEAGNEYGITNREYYKNLVLMSLLFTSFSFSFWLTDFQAEYLGTDMFIIFYANGIVCIITGPINFYLFNKLGLKMLLICTQCISITMSLFIILVQVKAFRYEDEEEEDMFIRVSIPISLLFMSLAI